MLERTCGLASFSPRAATSLAIALSSAGAGWPAVAYAHAVLASPWSEYFPSRGAASSAMPWSSAGAAWPDVAYAHARLERP